MTWVKAEYAAELAVVSAWLAALLPWSLTIQPDGPLGSIIFILRWPFAELQVRVPAAWQGETTPIEGVLDAAYAGAGLFGPFYIADPLSATTYDGFGWLAYGGYGWLLGALAVVLGVALSVALYVEDGGAPGWLPIDPVRAMALLLGFATVGFAVATVGVWFGPPRIGPPIPIGVVVVGALAAVLAGVERV